MSEKFRGLEVKPKPNEEPDRFIKRFLKKVRSDGILQEVYLRKAYEKPSVKRRRKSSRARFLKKIEERLE
jgi:small subunit ribosomal protein S21